MNGTLCSARKKDKCPNDTSFKYSTSLAVRETQFKTTLRFSLLPVGPATTN